MKRQAVFSTFFLFLSIYMYAQIPGMTSWQSATLNETQVRYRMHDRSINNGYALCEVSFDMSAARCALTREVTISIYENDGSTTNGTLRYSTTFDPGPGAVGVSTSEMTRVQVVSTGGTERLYARVKVVGLRSEDDFELFTPDATTSIVTADGYDPNEIPDDAVQIPSGVTHQGLLINDDFDCYQIAITSSNRHLVVSMDYFDDYRSSVANLNLDLFLMNESLLTLASSNSDATSTSSAITESIDEILVPGTYYIVVHQAQSVASRNFYELSWEALVAPDPDIGGLVRDNSSHDVLGVAMTGLPGTPLTDIQGRYSTTVASGWSGTVIPELEGYTFDPASRTYTDVTSDLTFENYVAYQIHFLLSGTIETSTGTPLSGVYMSGVPGLLETDVDGNYSRYVDYGWSGTITPTLEGYSFTPSSTTYTSVFADQVVNYTATLNTYTIDGHIEDLGETGIAGVSLPGLPGDPVTDADGYYTVQVDHGWSGTVTPVLDGYTFDPVSISYSNVTGDQSQDYVATLNTYTISGTVEVAGGDALFGVSMTGLPGNPTTDINGDYTAQVDHGWSGTVTPVLEGYSFDPISGSYTDVVTDRSGENYTATLNTYTISGTVSLSGGGALSAVVMEGLPGDPVTDASGNYTATANHGWSGTVVPVLAGYTFDPVAANYTGLSASQLQDYTATPIIYVIDGQVVDGEGAALSGVLMSGLPGDPLTDAAGYYSASVEFGTSITVTPTLDGYSFDPASVTYDPVVDDETGNYTGTRDPYLLVNEKIVYLTQNAGAFTQVAISSNVDWTASCPEDWISLAPASGNGDASMTITAITENLGIESRTARVTVAGSGFSRIVDVTQSGSGPFLEVSGVVLNFAPEAAAQMLTINSNLDWSAMETADWLTLAPESGSGDGVLTVTASANEMVESRLAIITVSAEGIARTVEVNQSGGASRLELSVLSGSLTAEAGSYINVDISSNIDWSVSKDAAWIQASPQSGSGDGTITLLADQANPDTTVRTALVTVAGDTMVRVITLTQDGAEPPVTGLAMTLADTELRVYPNPVKDRFFLESTLQVDSEVLLKLMDITGSTLYEETLPRLLPGVPVEMDLSTYPRGQYLLLLKTNVYKEVFKIMKSH